MYPRACADDRLQRQASTWHVVRWAIMAAATLALAVLFLSHASTAQAATPPAPGDDAVYTTFATCSSDDISCIVQQCRNGNYNYCYALNGGYAGSWGLGCYLGNRVCDPALYEGIYYNYPAFYNYPSFVASYVTPAVIAPSYPTYWPGYLRGNYWGNYCPSGNFSACFNGGNFFGGFCPSGNFSACANACPSGNFSKCLSVCPKGNYTCYGQNNIFFLEQGTTVVSATDTAVTTLHTQEVTQPVTTNAVAQPTQVTAPAATTTTTTAAPVAQPVQVAAPAPAAPQMATALNTNSAPAPAPAVTGGSGVHILSAQPATAPAATSGADDHHG